MCTLRLRAAFAFLVVLSGSIAVRAQPSTQPVSRGNWARVQALRANTKVHVAMDHGSKNCRVFAVDDNALTCKGGEGAGAVLARADIKHISVVHVGRSALVGAGVGGGIGALSGAIAGKSKPCPTGQGFCLNGIVSAGDVAAIFGVGGAVLGSIVGGLTDMTRGGAIYTRP